MNFIIIAGIAVIINLLWLTLSSKYLANFREGDSKIQVELAMHSPIQYIQEVLYTINLNGNNYFLSLFGSDLGWGELVKLYSIIPYSMFAIYIMATILDNDIKAKLKKYQIFWISITILAIIGLIFTSLYVQWTYVGNNSILGVQGRYFLPILPLIMLLIASKIKIKSLYEEKNVNKFVAISIMVLHIYTILQILIVHI